MKLRLEGGKKYRGYMKTDYSSILREKLNEENFRKLTDLNNPHIIEFVGEYTVLCNPDSVFVRTDSIEDVEYIKKRALSLGEEKTLAIKGHTIHYDGYYDQARDKINTRYLVPEDKKEEMSCMNGIDKTKGEREIRGIMKDIMKGKDMFVCFFCLGPIDSVFSVHAIQITDSCYVAHSDDILYRPGYESFKKLGKNMGNNFFKFVHSAGVLENFVSRNVDKRRIYIDLEDSLVYSTNTQYAGNSVGLKKLALRLAIYKASKEGWLCEHMFLMSVSDKNGVKKYFSGAYPSMCGKTSTAMLHGETIIGDDIVYLREKEGLCYGVNVERGIFGIIKGVNPKNDPLLYKSLISEGEVIFSNVLVKDKKPYWIGMGRNLPKNGINYSGEWYEGKKDKKGNEIFSSHKNARYTIHLKDLENVDENLNNHEGVEISGLIYGGRDSDTSVPVSQAFSWEHGITIKASGLESETTAATLGKEGVRAFNPMSNMDFLSIPLGKYIKMNLEFGKKLRKYPLIFSVNYFIKGSDGKFLNEIQDKHVWLKWMRLRVDKKVNALLTPTGFIPKYRDLKNLFEWVLEEEYKEEEYKEQFKLRIPENLEKIKRIRKIYSNFNDIPQILFDEIEKQKERLIIAKKKFGDYIYPEKFEEEDQKLI